MSLLVPKYPLEHKPVLLRVSEEACVTKPAKQFYNRAIEVTEAHPRRARCFFDDTSYRKRFGDPVIYFYSSL